MDKWNAIYLKTGAIVMQVLALLGAVLAEDTDGGSLLVAIPLSVLSLAMYGRGARATPEPVAPVAPPGREDQPRLEEMILNLQEDVNRLREDREFFRDLYVGGSPKAKELQERSRL